MNDEKIMLFVAIFIILYACIQHYRQCPNYKKYTLKKYYYVFYLSVIAYGQMFIFGGLCMGNVFPVVTKKIFTYFFIVDMSITMGGIHAMLWSMGKIAETAIPYFEKERNKMKIDNDKIFNEYLIDIWRSKKNMVDSSKTELKIIDAIGIILAVALLIS